MDAFVAPIDVNFRPKAPTSNENKKAIANIHGCIADFFYESSVSFNCARSDSYSKMMQAIVQYNDPSNCIAKLALDKKNESQTLRDLIVYRTKVGRLGKRGAQACVKTIAPIEWWITFGSEVPVLQRFVKRVIGLTSAASSYEMIWSTFDNIHTKKRNCLEHDRIRDIAYIQYNKRLKKRYEERTDITYGMLEDAEDGLDDPPLTHTSRTNTASQGVSSSQSTTCHLQNSSDDDDYDVDANYDVGDGNDDGINSRSDEDI
ncbi:hypothetical protein GIB67_016267 [Kingdonia uniflora]|uniref:HAT C-terminal dimerisation domain-containing protein n=1 Tax=Kingdonia uniflora TaxID=39325 RepID=A0A7J7M995_9MAGN|nr:hypothetical protein GIB67_016267 [Kingdonia uniflora]